MNRQPYRISALQEYHLAQHGTMGTVNDWRVVSDYGNPAQERETASRDCAMADISPLQTIEVRGKGLGDWLIKALDVQSPPDIGESTVCEVGIVMRLRDDLALLRGGVAGQSSFDLSSIASSGTDIAVTDVSSGLTGIALLGPNAWTVLSARTQIPVTPSRFANGAVAQGGFAGVRATLLRLDSPHGETFELYAARQYGLYLWGQLLTALERAGGRPAGWQTWTAWHDDASHVPAQTKAGQV